MLLIIRDFFRKIGVDKAIAFTVLARIIQAFGGIVSIVFIAKFLSGNEQGYYYTFSSILAIQIFFELGLSGIITQYTAHEFAHLKWVDNDLDGQDYHKSRVSSLLRFCVKWFGIISIILFFILMIAGFVFFSKYNANDHVSWQNPWIILCISTSLNLFIDPILAFIEGLGEVKDMAQLRLVQKTANVILLFLFFALGFKLYSAALASLIAIGINFIQLLFAKRRIRLTTIWRLHGESTINYVKEIFPYQWRIALSWISGYFIFQLFNPVLFAYSGAVIAGQMGMSLQILNGISGLSMSWITTKVPLFSSFIAHGNYNELNKVFKKTLKNLLGVNFAMILFFYALYIVLFIDKVSYANRFLSPVPLALLCCVTIVNQLVFSWATYLRCHKQEPFLINSIVIGILCALSTMLLGRYFGIFGLVTGYAFITIIISLPWAYLIFKTKKAEWHNANNY
ncbi:oligosaccharide flippase family protein [Mucilaginibacter sp. dw_454]|uniref:oligosaccharide flippase family protein n=1 Tax=Mucilaginibacter sp. dw_454 TaxID=2720079 RepID=UPI001BD60F30|nr:oligosaccharide flippase family protein [Mucilaginibacter sp. dw_454]